MTDNNRRYTVVLPNGEQETWDADKYERNKVQLHKDYPNVGVWTEDDVTSDADIDNASAYRITLPDGESEVWDAGKYERNRAQLFKDYPEVSVGQLTITDYWGDNLKDLDGRLNAIEQRKAQLQAEYDALPRQARNRAEYNFPTWGMSDEDKAATEAAKAKRKEIKDYEKATKKDLEAIYYDLNENPIYKGQRDEIDNYIAEQQKVISAGAQAEYDKNPVFDSERTIMANLGAAELAADSGRLTAEQRLYHTADRLLADAYSTLHAPGRYEASNGWANFGRGIIDGMQDLSGLITMVNLIDQTSQTSRILKKIKAEQGNEVSLFDFTAGEKPSYLSDGEWSLLRATVTKAQVEAYRADGPNAISRMYQAGQQVPMQASFMVGFGATRGIGQAAVAGVKKVLPKAVSNIGERMATNKAGRFIVNQMTNLGEGLVRTAVETPFQLATYNNMMQGVLQIDDKGHIDMSAGNWANKYADSMVEVLSEMSGERVMGWLTEPLKGVGKVAGRGIGKVVNGKEFWGANTFRNFARMVRESAVTGVLKKGGWDGLVPEVMEEFYGNAVRQILGIDPQAFTNFATWDNLVITVASFAPMSAFGLGGSAAQAIKSGRDFKTATASLDKMLSAHGYTEGQIQDIHNACMNAATPQEVSDQLSALGVQLAKDNATESDLQTIVDYTHSLTEYKLQRDIQEIDTEERRNQEDATIRGELGGSMSYTMTAEGKTDNVRVLTEPDGTQWFVQSEDEDGGLALIARGVDGQSSTRTRFISADEAANLIESGELTDSGEISRNDFLDREIVRKKNYQESVRMAQDMQKKVQEVESAFPPGTQVNMGTEENPVMGTVVQTTEDGVVIADAEGKMKLLPLEDAAKIANVSLEVKTDEQLDEEEADALEVKDAVRKTVRESNGQITVERDGHTYHIVNAVDNPDSKATFRVRLEDESGNRITVDMPVAEVQMLVRGYEEKRKREEEAAAAQQVADIQNASESAQENGAPAPTIDKTESSETSGPKVIQETADGTVVQYPDGKTALIPKGEAIPTSAETQQGADAQTANTDGQAGNTAAQTTDANTPTSDAGTQTDGQAGTQNGEQPSVPMDSQGKPLPLRTNSKGEQVVDEKTLWNNSPEEWCIYNDRNEDRVMSSDEMLDSAVKALDKQQKDVEKKMRKAQETMDMDALDGLKEERKRLNDRKARLTAIQASRAEAAKIAEQSKREAREAEADAKFAEEKRRRDEAKAKKAAELAKYNTESMADIRKKWSDAPKETGYEDEIVLNDGTVIKGHYVLTEANAPTASHDTQAGYAKTKGFPVDANGRSVNDRDYEHDKDAQAQVEQKAQSYDQRALQTPVVVSQDGVVLSGNDRTMASQIAARNGTDGRYVEYLSSHAGKYGFTAEQVGQYSNPRVLFVVDGNMPYDAATFAKFNADEKKSQSKTESAVKAGKTLSQETIEQIADIINRYDTIAEVYADPKAVNEILSILVQAGHIQQNEVSKLRDGDRLSGTGEDVVESILLGAVMQEDALRCAMEDRSIRRVVMSALAQLVSNGRLGDYALTPEFSQAVVLLYQAKRSGLVKQGESVANYMSQPVLAGFGENPVASAAIQMIANVINGAKVKGLKNLLTSYNTRAENAAAGQADLFLGGVENKEDIIREILNEYGYNTETFSTAEQRAAGEQSGTDSSGQSAVREAAEQGGNTEEQAPYAVQGVAGNGAVEQNNSEGTANTEGQTNSSGNTNTSGEKTEESAAPKNEGQFGLVSDARMEELKKRLKAKLTGQLNSGFDPEVLAIGMEMAAGYIDRGIKSFVDFSSKMIADFGDIIRPYLKAFYNGAREMPGMEDLAKEMDSHDAVSAFDVNNFDKQAESKEAKEEKPQEAADTADSKQEASVESQTELTDKQGNPLNDDGTLKVEEVKSIDELTDEDFTAPTRNVQLPALSQKVSDAIGADGKPVVIKKNIFARNSQSHSEVTPQQAREILSSALYRPDLYGQNQKASRPYNWIVINTKDADGQNRLVVLEVNDNKDNIEIVHWYSVDARGVEKIKRQAQKEGGHILTLPSETEEAGALSGRQSGLSSKGKGNNQSSKKQTNTASEKIDDVGEKIAGARKDMLRDMAKSMQEVTEESLIALPFAKAFKRPDLNKAVAEGALRPKDARFAEAVMAALLSHPKPRLSQSRSSYDRAKSAKAIENWAKEAKSGADCLERLFSMDEAQRDEFIEQVLNLKAYNESALEARLADLRKWNPKSDIESWGRCRPLNPVAVFFKVYEQLGYDSYGDVKCPVAQVAETIEFDYYRLNDAYGRGLYLSRLLLTEQDVVDEIVYATKVANGDMDTDLPKSMFTAIGKEPTYDVTGYYFAYSKGLRGKIQQSEEFKTSEEAEKARQEMKDNGYSVGNVLKSKSITGYGKYLLTFRTPTGEYIDLQEFTFGSKEELLSALDERHDEINEAVNSRLSDGKPKGERKSKDNARVMGFWDAERNGFVYGVYLSDKYTPKSAFSNMPYTIKEGFATRKEAQAYLDEHKAEIDKMADDIDKARRGFIFFDGTNESRVGDDYRKGKDVSAEEFRSAFGFRGVQFGNWTNQKDRQAAINNAYDSLMDLAKLLGISPKALSLNGELGIAFGARGSGKASAHYESAEVVINLTKTKGAGSLAHEWWHALDNYFSRQGNVKSGFVTDNRGIKMRDEMRQAFNRLLDSLEKSDYDSRSRRRGADYWGSKVEETARMFEMWVSSEMAKRGERNNFLVGEDANMEEAWAKMNYAFYHLFAEKSGRTPMDFEEFKKTPYALDGFAYPTQAELETFGKDLRNIFDTVQERVDEETGNVALFQMDGSERSNESPESQLAFDTVTELLDMAGVETELLSNEEMEQLAEGATEDASLSRSKSPRAKWLDAYVALVSRMPGKNRQTARAEMLQKIAQAKKEAKELYERVLSGNFDELTLQKINQYIDNATNRNRFFRPLSQRLPERALLSLSKDDRTAAVDALFSRICESTVPANGRTRAEGRRKIEARKEELLEAWAKATGNWHESIADFTSRTDAIRSGTDSDVYLSDDGTKVIKASKGKFDNRKFPTDIDQVPLFNSVFPGSAYRIVGYGRVNGKFVRFLEQPFVDFSTATPLSTEERVAYMKELGFKAKNEEKTLFSNGEIVVSDLQKSNIVKGSDGNVWVIDADVKLHTKDMGGNYTYPPVETDTDTAELMTVYHGSGARFDHFDHSFMGTGEGAQAYGWGSYVTEVEGIGRTYAEENPQPLEEEVDLSEVQYDILWDIEDYYGIKGGIEELEYDGNGGFHIFDVSREKSKLEKWADYFLNNPEEFGYDEPSNYDLNDNDSREEFARAIELAIQDKALEFASEYDSKFDGMNRSLYTVEIPDNNGNNYLDYDKTVPSEEKERVFGALADAIIEGDEDGSYEDEFSQKALREELKDSVDGRMTGKELYGNVSAYLGSDKAASEFLNSLGYVGIKYPAENLNGGREDGASNYVIFNEDDLKIVDRIEFLRNGSTVYGAAVGGKILLNAERLNPNTPVHEYTHLWDKAVQQKNPELWKQGVELMKQTSLWQQVANDPNYAGLDENGIASEVHSRLVGEKGEAELKRMSREVLDGNGGILDKAAKMSVIQKLRKWLSEFWYWVKNTLTPWSAEEAGRVTLEDFVNMPLADLAKGTRFDIASMETPIHESKGTFKNLAEAEDWAKKNLQGKSYTNQFTGDEVRISGKSISEMLNPKSSKKISEQVHLAALQSVPDFIKTGIPAEIHKDTHGRDFEVLRLYNAIEIDGQIYRVKSTIKKLKEGDRYYTYEIQEMELIGGTQSPAVGLDGYSRPQTYNSISGANLLKGVKKTNSDELILPEDNDIRFQIETDNTGEPVRFRENASADNADAAYDEISAVNSRFNEELEKQANGELEKGHIYQLGKPSAILRSTGVPNLPIELTSQKLAEKSEQRNHTFDILDVAGLPAALQNPMAVFSYGDKGKAQNIIVSLQRDGKQFVVGLHFNQEKRGLLVNDIRGLFNKNNAEWLNWISQGKALYINKGEIQALIDQQRTNLAEVEYLDLDSIAKVVNEFENPKLDEETATQNEAGAEELAASSSKDRRPQSDSPVANHSVSLDGMREAGRQMSESLGVEVEFISDSELPEGHHGAMGMWKGGKVYVCIENHANANEVKKTILHEVVGHKGLRNLVGNRAMDSFCMEVYKALPEEMRRKITESAFKHYHGNFALATEEYLAEQVENGEFLNFHETVWGKIKAAVRGLLRRLGFDVSLTKNDIMYLLWQSYNSRNGGILTEARRVAVANRLGLSMSGKRISSKAREEIRERRHREERSDSAAAIYNNAVTDWKTRLNESFVDMFNSVKMLADAIEKQTKNKMQDFENINLVLNQQSSKELAAVSKWERDYYNPMWDAIQGVMNAAHCSQEEVTRYAMLKHGLERNEVLAARDAREYWQKQYDTYVKSVKANSELSKAEKEEELEKAKEALDKHLDDVKKGTDAKFKELREKDYSGLNAMYIDNFEIEPQGANESDEEYQTRVKAAMDGAAKYKTLAEAEEAARKEVEDFEKNAGESTNKLWQAVNNATKSTLKSQYESNMLSKEQYNEVKDMFQFYVPMRGFADNTAEDMYTYYTSSGRGNTFTQPLQNAKGRKSRAASPWGYIGAQASSAIAANEKNNTKLRLWYFVSNRPEQNIVTVSDVWYQKTGRKDKDGKDIYEPVYPMFSADLNTEQAKEEYDNWLQGMEELRSQGMAYKGTKKLDIRKSVVHIDKSHEASHIIKFKVGGEDKMMFINGNPRAAQAINNMLNLDAATDAVTVGLQKVLRMMSGLNTSYNPAFWISNMQRDLLFSLMAVNVKEDGRYSADFVKNLARASKVVSMVRREHRGKLGDSKLEKLYAEFKENGGVTGFTVIKDNEEWERMGRKMLADRNKAGRQAMKVLESIQDFGEGIEQMTRFAAYLTSREHGKSVMQSVADAKELTVNFNRKGSGKTISWEESGKLTYIDWNGNRRRLGTAGRVIAVGSSMMAGAGRRLIMFFNAGVQGLNTMYQLWTKDHRKTTMWITGYFALGVLNALLHALCDPDDDYLDMPDYERRNNLLLGTNGYYMKWALPQECRVFYAMGDILVNQAMGRMPHANSVGEVLRSVGDILPVNPMDGARGMMPQVLVPIAEVMQNEDYKGVKIHPDMKYLSDGAKDMTPAFSYAYSNTGKTYVLLSQMLNAISGGDKYEAGAVNIAPEDIEHIVGGYGGGLATTLNQSGRTIGGTFKMFFDMANGMAPEEAAKENLSIRSTPFLNRVFVSNDDRYRNAHVADLFDFYKAKAESVSYRQKQMISNEDWDALDKLLESRDYEEKVIYDSYKKIFDFYNKSLRSAETNTERRDIMKEQDEYRKEMIEEIANIE